MSGPGRKPMPPEERRQVKNITVDADIQDRLNELADRLEEGFGFRPTISQTLRYLLKRAGDRQP